MESNAPHGGYIDLSHHKREPHHGMPNAGELCQWAARNDVELVFELKDGTTVIAIPSTHSGDGGAVFVRRSAIRYMSCKTIYVYNNEPED